MKQYCRYCINAVLTENEETKFGEFEEKMAVCGSNFLGRQMEP